MKKQAGQRPMLVLLILTEHAMARGTIGCKVMNGIVEGKPVAAEEKQSWEWHKAW